MDGPLASTDMTRSSFRFPLIESLAILGMFAGAWLMHQAFSPDSDIPNRAILVLGVADMVISFGVFAYVLRERLRGGVGLTRSWIITGSVLLAVLLGWNFALMIDADRLLVEEKRQHELEKQLGKLEDSLRHFREAIPRSTLIADKNAWQTNHDRYAVLQGQIQTALRGNEAWEKDLSRIHEQVQSMQKLVTAFPNNASVEERGKLRTEYQQARDRAVQIAEALRNAVDESARALSATHRQRWQAVGGTSITAAMLIFGAMLMWLVFDRALQRSRERVARLEASEARYRQVVENHPDPLAVLDANGAIAYVNPAWRAVFGFEAQELVGRRFMELVHADDRPRVYAASGPVLCRLSADYGIWHDVELLIERDPEKSVVRIRDLRETSELPILRKSVASV